LPTLDAFIQVAGYLTLVFSILDVLVLMYKFVRRTTRKLAEPIVSTESKRLFGLWTLMVFILLMLSVCVIAAVVFFLKMSIQVFLVALALAVVLAVFVWLMPWVVPALGETVRESLKKRYG